MSKSLTYADSGVDIEKGNLFVEKIKSIVEKTPQMGVMSNIGGFGGLFTPNLNNLKKPVLVSSTDGVGTKLKLAFMMNKHDTIGIDCVAMCVNDIAVLGAKPLFFLDYLSMGSLDVDVASHVVEGIAEGCKQAKCALLGGETAEMPDIYNDNEYDLAGFSVGIVDDTKIIEHTNIRKGHQIIGIGSTGVHSNGFSLVRKICFDLLKLDIDTHIPELGKTIGEELLTPTKIYSEIVQRIINNLQVDGFAHITGGGINDNLVRILPSTRKAIIKKNSWEILPIFDYLQKSAKIEDAEMIKTFNMGIGMIAVVPENSAQDVMDRISSLGEKPYLMGEIVGRKPTDDQIEWV